VRAGCRKHGLAKELDAGPGLGRKPYLFCAARRRAFRFDPGEIDLVADDDPPQRLRQPPDDGDVGVLIGLPRIGDDERQVGARIARVGRQDAANVEQDLGDTRRGRRWRRPSR
jgi:hypothetical protein